MYALSSENWRDGASTDGRVSMEGLVLWRLIGREKLYEGRGRFPLADISDDTDGDRGIVEPVMGVKGEWVRDRLELGDRLRCWCSES